ncbi:MAG TPA: hypothetical protein VFN66_07975 [Burkholderiales bacterium]|nr:hypothetical protein [Burkholderiales bacterium]
MFLFAGHAFGDNSGSGGYSSAYSSSGNAYNRNGGTNRNADRQHNINTGSFQQPSHASGYFPLGSDLRDKPVHYPDGKTSAR